MRLTELKPEFVRYETRVEPRSIIVGPHETWHERGRPTEEVIRPCEYTIVVPTLAEAQGIRFLCPQCFRVNAGPRGTHLCSVTFEARGAAPSQGSHDTEGRPARWTVSGSGFDDLSTQPSILLIGGCNWHGDITNGEVT